LRYNSSGFQEAVSIRTSVQGLSVNRIIGMILIIISAASFGTLAIFGRLAYQAGLDTFSLLFLRFTFAALLLFALLAVRKESLPRGKTLLQLIGMGALGYAGQSFSYLSAIKYASAGLVALLLYLYPLFVAVLSAIFLKEKFSAWKIGALLLATIGASLTANPEGGQWRGIALAIASAVIYSIYIIVGTGVMRHVTALQSSTVIFTSAGVVYAALTAISGAPFPQTGAGWGAVAGIVVFATVIPVVTFLAGLKRIGPTNASMLSTLEPVVTVILAAILFGETLQSGMLIGGGLILISVVILARSEVVHATPPQVLKVSS
jgi:drug/metabolite transporter (DMT)-like permease